MYFYDIPTLIVFLMFIVFIPIVSISGLHVFKNINMSIIRCPENNNAMIGVYVGISSIFLGVMISFLVVTVWNNYTTTQLNGQQEAQYLIILYQILNSLPNTEKLKIILVEYIEYVINIEYPELRKGNTILYGAQILSNLQTNLYNYTPNDSRESSLYSTAIDAVEKIINFRVNRIHNGTAGLNEVVWWVCILDSVVIIIVTWFLICDSIFHYFLVFIISIFISAGIFIISILSYPFRGYDGLTAQPFIDTLKAIESLNN